MTPSPVSHAESGSFRLEKWYFDVAESAGRAHIAYWARLSWLGLAVTWQSVASYARRAEPRRKQSLGVRAGPQREGDCISWVSTPLRARVAVDPAIAGFAEQLASGVRWECFAPSAHVELEIGDQVTRGVGYAERITLSVAPWQLPIRELRWGRWCSDDASKSVVWIEWRAEKNQSWVYVDGVATTARVGDDSVGNDHFWLALGDTQVLEQRSFGEVASRIPRLARMLPTSMHDMKEEKWLSRGLLHEGGLPPTAGMSIHEVVTFG